MTTTCQPEHQPVERKHGRWLVHVTKMWSAVCASVAVALLTIQTFLQAKKYEEDGNVVTDNLAWIVFGVIAVVAIGALIKTLGASVISWVGNQLGVG